MGFASIQDVLLKEYSSDEFVNRLREIIDYARLPVVRYEWTRVAYEDLTSGGTPFTEPEAKMVSYREMNSSETAVAIQEVVLSLPLVPGKVREMLYNEVRTLCSEPVRSAKQQRCMRCKSCINYVKVIDTIRGKFLEKNHDQST